jgi:hypothetical protein
VGISNFGACELPKELAKLFCCRQLPVGCPKRPHVKHLPSPAVKEALQPVGEMLGTAKAGFFSAGVSFMLAWNWASAIASASNAISSSIISSS